MPSYQLFFFLQLSYYQKQKTMCIFLKRASVLLHIYTLVVIADSIRIFYNILFRIIGQIFQHFCRFSWINRFFCKNDSICNTLSLSADIKCRTCVQQYDLTFCSPLFPGEDCTGNLCIFCGRSALQFCQIYDLESKVFRYNLIGFYLFHLLVLIQQSLYSM